MSVFSLLCIKIIPLYVLVGCGFIAGRFFNVDRHSIAMILFYIVVPFVLFEVGLNVQLKAEYLLLPIIFLMFSIILCFSYLKIARYFFQDGRANLIAFAAGTGNTGYFGLPLALMLFDDKMVALYMLGNLGLSIYDYTIGAYIITAGSFTKKEAIHKVSRLPMLYAFALGTLFKYLGITIGPELLVLVDYMKNTYIVLGMMIVGLGLASVESFELNGKFLSIFLCAKFIAAPLLVLSFILLDKSILHIFHNKEFLYDIMILLSIVPPAANTVVFATINKCYPQQAATAVLLGTLLGLFYVPAMVAVLL